MSIVFSIIFDDFFLFYLELPGRSAKIKSISSLSLDGESYSLWIEWSYRDGFCRLKEGDPSLIRSSLLLVKTMLPEFFMCFDFLCFLLDFLCFSLIFYLEALQWPLRLFKFDGWLKYDFLLGIDRAWGVI